MLLATRSAAPVRYLSAHVTDFRDARELFAWRRCARRELPRLEGLAFAKGMRQVAGAASFGFGPGLPDLGRLVLLAAWPDVATFERFCAGGLGRALTVDAEFGWHAFGEVISTRGSHYGRRPIAPGGSGQYDGPIAVLTLGRTSPRALGRFVVHGSRLTGHILGADGVVSATSAGFPLTGNATFSLWDSTQHMVAFSYGAASPRGHIDTVKSKPPILVEQLNARIRPFRIDGRWNPTRTHHPERLARLATLVNARGE